ncbi:MAG: protoheme IX farnesyltransferase [Chloroflexi bacterium]|nr:MAG: protoheme IX farnesyltransferase [Chloroflexota bacterium]
MSVAVRAPAAVPARTVRLRATAADYLSLTKPRIIALLELCALAAMVMAARGWPGTGLVLATMVGGALAAGGANTINQWFDRDIDAVMTRTCSRAIPDGRIDPLRALTFGVGLSALAFLVLTVFADLLAAVLAMSALLFYVFVYTMYLKRTSMQNIVIGGAAGAVPPLVGWAAVTGRLDLTALFLFAIVFYWTPPHFWALALLVRGDYQRAGVPMLPVVAGERHTRSQIVLYTVILVVVTLLPMLAHSFGAVYLAGAAGLDAVFLTLALRLWTAPATRSAALLFHYSLLYLALLFAVAALDRVIGG